MPADRHTLQTAFRAEKDGLNEALMCRGEPNGTDTRFGNAQSGVILSSERHFVIALLFAKRAPTDPVPWRRADCVSASFFHLDQKMWFCIPSNGLTLCPDPQCSPPSSVLLPGFVTEVTGRPLVKW
ncbi:hypothetical protein COCON_G00043350 [Conger conger]|uniref:Uncharacterized protein n=1 Tax=Conger conger TaxID=82655 RepID=A0A9Q1DU73_CONCO|nr:hypothetical protein COCON_G00043350 [Conger conger]